MKVIEYALIVTIVLLLAVTLPPRLIPAFKCELQKVRSLLTTGKPGDLVCGHSLPQ
jgi:hypothetical protein